jgi:hypothetical protein
MAVMSAPKREKREGKYKKEFPAKSLPTWKGEMMKSGHMNREPRKAEGKTHMTKHEGHKAAHHMKHEGHKKAAPKAHMKHEGHKAGHAEKHEGKHVHVHHHVHHYGHKA